MYYIVINKRPVTKSEKILKVRMKNKTNVPLRCVGTFKIKDMIHPKPIELLITAI